jgi:hypothetical protein
MRARRSALAVCAAVLATPASASAATMTFEPDPFGVPDSDRLVYRAAPGEQNVVSVARTFRDDDEEEWTITDTGAATIAAPTSCTHPDIHTVRCVAIPGRSFSRSDFDLGDLADRFSNGDDMFALVFASGGAGDDTLDAGAGAILSGDAGDDVLNADKSADAVSLKGGPGDDLLRGGAWGDVLDGGGGRDQLYGRGGDDRMKDRDRDGATGEAGPGPDLFVGGRSGCCGDESGDRVSYRGRTEPVFVDLGDDRPDGERGEGDRFVDIETVEGGSGDDRLVGDDGPNGLVGRPGADVLSGRGGRDVLIPGTGPDRIKCGKAADAAGPPTTRDRLGSDCEFVREDITFGVPARPRRAKPGRMTYVAACRDIDEDDDGVFESCWGALHLREADGAERLLGVGTFPRGGTNERRFSIVLTPLGRRLAARRVMTTLRLTLRTEDAYNGEPSVDTIRWTTPLRF